MGQRDYGGHGRIRARGHELILPLTAHVVVEGRPGMGNASRRTGGAILDRLHTGHRQLYVPERGGMGRTAKYGPLISRGLPPQSRSFCALALPQEAHMLPHQASGDPGQYIPHVCRSPGGHSQATSAGMPLSGMYFSGDLEPHQYQDCGAPTDGPTDLLAPQTHDQGRDPGGQAQTTSQSRVRGGVPPCVQYTFYSRGMDLYVGMV